MNEDECPVVLVTCSGLSNTGKCTTRAVEQLRRQNPDMIDCHIIASGENPMALPEGLDTGFLRVVVVDGCEDFCGRKKAERCGLVPDCHVVATDCGVVKSGMDEPAFRDIETVCRAAEWKIRR